jgi:hypothetical protein
MPGVAQLSVSDLKETSRLSFAMLLEKFPAIHWLHSYATDDILYCVYRAPNEEVIRQYAAHSTLPVHRISRVLAMIEPTTLEDPDQERAAARQRMMEHARFCRHLVKDMPDGPARESILRTAAMCEETAARADA